jgi:hypothetical protein
MGRNRPPEFLNGKLNATQLTIVFILAIEFFEIEFLGFGQSIQMSAIMWEFERILVGAQLVPLAHRNSLQPISQHSHN